MVKRRRRELVEADQFHAIVVSLLHVRHADWTEWEHEWLLDQAQRPSDYIFTENQRDKLNQLVAYSKSFTHYAEYSVQELLMIAYPYRFDLNEDDQTFLEDIYRWQAMDLKRRQIQRLARICRSFERIGRDPLEKAA